jgi:Zn-dependent protease
MGWSFRLGRLAGIDIYVHYTFLIFLAVIGFSGFLETGNVASAALGIGLTAAVFGIIVLHELGHAMAARYYGIPTRDITLLPIGGVARLERMPDKPGQELVVALAGPAVNVVLAVIFGVLSGFDAILHPGAALTVTGEIVHYLYVVNVFLVLFNLIPAFPMDGGRVLRALLALRIGAPQATEIAAKIGKVIAVLFVFAGLFGVPGVFESNIMLLLVALFVWTGADAEARAYRTRAGLSGATAAEVMVRHFAVVDPDDTLASVADLARQTFQRDFPVVVGGRLVGLVSREDLRAGLNDLGSHGRVFQTMRREFPTIGPDEPAERGLNLLAGGASTVPVVAYGQLAGLLTPEHLSEFIHVQRMSRDHRSFEHEVRSRA